MKCHDETLQKALGKEDCATEAHLIWEADMFAEVLSYGAIVMTGLLMEITTWEIKVVGPWHLEKKKNKKK